MFSSQIYCVTFVNHRCTGGFTYFTLHFIHATFCIEPRISNDGKGYKEIKSEVYPVASKEDRNGIYTHELSFDTVQAHYVKITARPEYDIPTWHWGKGRPAFIFVDEIGLE